MTAFFDIIARREQFAELVRRRAADDRRFAARVVQCGEAIVVHETLRDELMIELGEPPWSPAREHDEGVLGKLGHGALVNGFELAAKELARIDDEHKRRRGP